MIRTRKREHITPVLNSLSRIAVKYRSKYEILTVPRTRGVTCGQAAATVRNNQNTRCLQEKGEDKPDGIIEYKTKSAFIDWKAKHKKEWLVNKRAVEAYERWSKKFELPVIIAFFVFDSNNNLLEKRFAFLGKHNYFVSKGKQWDKNQTVEFENDLPEFNKAEILNYLL